MKVIDSSIRCNGAWKLISVDSSIAVACMQFFFVGLQVLWRPKEFFLLRMIFNLYMDLFESCTLCVDYFKVSRTIDFFFFH